MREAGFFFRTESPDVEESFPPDMPVHLVPRFLAEKKARVFENRITDEVVMTSDTVVILDNQIMNKPLHRTEAIDMLEQLSGRTHTVITAVCLLSMDKTDCFDDRTEVTFKKLSRKEIEYYVDNFKPYDKAGAYGAQDCLLAGVNPCSPVENEFLKKINRTDLIEKTTTHTKAGIAMVAIEKIEGSYFTVMGLPIHKVYEHLNRF
jgi:septum formation protein